MDRVERVDVQDRLDEGAILGQLIDGGFDRALEGIAVEQHELAVLAPHEGGLRPDVENAADAERAADVPEPVAKVDDLVAHGCAPRC